MRLGYHIKEIAENIGFIIKVVVHPRKTIALRHFDSKFLLVPILSGFNFDLVILTA